MTPFAPPLSHRSDCPGRNPVPRREQDTHEASTRAEVAMAYIDQFFHVLLESEGSDLHLA